MRPRLGPLLEASPVAPELLLALPSRRLQPIRDEEDRARINPGSLDAFLTEDALVRRFGA